MTLAPAPQSTRPTSPAALAGGTRFAPLDGIRAVAVVAVLLYHGDVLGGGYLGVDVFFVLSGFLITSLLLAEHERTSTIAAGSFWTRRAFRLLPALVCYLVVGLIASLVLKPPHELVTYLQHAVTSVLGVNNWLRVAVPDSEGAWDGHLWSLSVEAQFYLVWPVALLLVLRSRRLRSRLAAVLATIVVLVAGWRLVLVSGLLSGHYPGLDRYYFATDTRADALLIGALLAVVWRQGLLGRVPERAWTWVSGAAWALLVVAAVLSPRLEDEPSWLGWGGFTAVAIVAALAIAAAVVAPSRGVSRLFGWAPLVWVGGVSYALYLWHYPVVVQLDAILAPHLGFKVTAVVALAVATVAAWASTRFVERPLGRLRAPFEQRFLPRRPPTS